MIEFGLGANLPMKAGDCLRRASMPGQHFDGDDASHQRVFGLEDLSHPPLADRIDNAIGPQVEANAASQQLLGLPAIKPP